MQQRLNVNYRIKWKSNWHVGSGFRTAATDRLIQRMGGRDGRPFVPGSQIKGVLRHTCERFAQSLGLEAVDPHATGSEQQRRLVRYFEPLSKSNLIIDRLFGNRFQGDCLFVDNALPSPTDVNGRSESDVSPVRARTAMDRVTGTVKERHLFTTEMADSDLRLAGSIRARHPAGVLTHYDQALPYEYGLLIAAFLSIDMLGGDKSSGLGQCHVEIDEIIWNGTTTPIDDCLSPLAEIAEFDSKDLTEWIQEIRAENQS